LFIGEEDYQTINNVVMGGIKWCEDNADTQLTKEEYEARRKEAEDVVKPILTKMYQNAAPGPDQQPAPDADGDKGPTVEEVD